MACSVFDQTYARLAVVEMREASVRLGEGLKSVGNGPVQEWTMLMSRRPAQRLCSVLLAREDVAVKMALLHQRSHSQPLVVGQAPSGW